MLSRMTIIIPLVVAMFAINDSLVWANATHKDVAECITILSQIHRASSVRDSNSVKIQAVVTNIIKGVHSTDQLKRVAFASWSLSIGEAGDECVLGYFRTAFWCCIDELCDRRDKGDARAVDALAHIRRGLHLGDRLWPFEIRVDHRVP